MSPLQFLNSALSTPNWCYALQELTINHNLGQNELFAATQAGLVERVRELCRQNFDVNGLDVCNRTPLQAALQNCRLNELMCQTLIELRTNLDNRDSKGQTILDNLVKFYRVPFRSPDPQHPDNQTALKCFRSFIRAQATLKGGYSRDFFKFSPVSRIFVFPKFVHTAHKISRFPELVQIVQDENRYEEWQQILEEQKMEALEEKNRWTFSIKPPDVLEARNEDLEQFKKTAVFPDSCNLRLILSPGTSLEFNIYELLNGPQNPNLFDLNLRFMSHQLTPESTTISYSLEHLNPCMTELAVSTFVDYLNGAPRLQRSLSTRDLLALAELAFFTGELELAKQTLGYLASLRSYAFSTYRGFIVQRMLLLPDQVSDLPHSLEHFIDEKSWLKEPEFIALLQMPSSHRSPIEQAFFDLLTHGQREKTERQASYSSSDTPYDLMDLDVLL